MPQLYRPCTAEGEDAAQYEGAWVRFYYPVGADIKAVCAERGWAYEMPEGVRVFGDNGEVLQEAPAATVVEAVPAPEKGK